MPAHEAARRGLSQSQRVGLGVGMIAGLVTGMIIGYERAKETGNCTLACAPMNAAFSMIVGGGIGFVVGGGAGLLIGTVVDSARDESRLVLGVTIR